MAARTGDSDAQLNKSYRLLVRFGNAACIARADPAVAVMPLQP